MLGLSLPSLRADGPIRLHPDNPHYFLWQDRPTLLVTSGEHYGAVLNLDFDFRTYLDTLAADGLNLTRTFTGAYVEPKGAFNIARNTLAPDAQRFICPWARSSEPGYANGGPKFDLTRWDESYFSRLKQFLRHAGDRGVIVEFTLFCPMYEDTQWNLSPMNARNNVNQVGAIGRNEVHTLDRNGGLLAFQEGLARKVVTELNAFDNLMFEICNEPYFGGVTMAWQHRIADVIVETERGLPKRHLITQNIANNKTKVQNPHPAVSVFNFHYASPPDTVAMNHGLNKVIGDNETGFRGTADAPYRIEAWAFLLAGGGLFNHLDYSFVAGHEDGSFRYPDSQPGGGNAGFRKQMKLLGDFLRGFDFIHMRPDPAILGEGMPGYALANRSKEIAVHFGKAGLKEVTLHLPDGSWNAEWVDTQTGKVTAGGAHAGGKKATLAVPAYDTDIALRLRRD